MSFESLYTEYIEDCSHRLRQTTVENKEAVFKSQILPFFKDIPINKIDALYLRRWQNEILKKEVKGKPLSQTYIKTVNNQVSAILNYAVKFYNLPSNPMHKTGSIGKKHAETMNFWTLDEFQEFIPFVSDKPQSKMMFSLMFWSGMRVGELLALTENDFDRDNLTVSVNKSYTRLRKKDIISKPKTPKSKRLIALPEFLFDYLEEYLDCLYDYSSEDRLFEHTFYFLRHEMNRGTKHSGIKKIRLHDLRHSHASMLIELGVSPILVQERLGHEEIETTLQTYSHLYPNKQQDVAKQLDKLNSSPFQVQS